MFSAGANQMFREHPDTLSVAWQPVLLEAAQLVRDTSIFHPKGRGWYLQSYKKFRMSPKFFSSAIPLPEVTGTWINILESPPELALLAMKYP